MSPGLCHCGNPATLDRNGPCCERCARIEKERAHSETQRHREFSSSWRNRHPLGAWGEACDVHFYKVHLP